MAARRYGRINLATILFAIFWWFVSRFSLRSARRLLVAGIRDGAFPAKKVFDPILKVTAFDHTFSNPIGVGAGLDKRTNLIDGLIEMGYSFGEFGSYTLEKETPLKKVFYLKKDKAIVVQSLGYRNPGLDAIVPDLIARRHFPHWVGVNLTTSAPSESENIKMNRQLSYEEEFQLMIQKVAPYCDYITLNFAHPDIELSQLISDKALILPILKKAKEAISRAAPINTPKLFVKVPLDMTPLESASVCDIMMEAKVDGVIVAGVQSMFKTARKLSDSKYHHNTGMLAGKPIKDMSTELIRRIHQHTMGRLPIIASGGVFTGEDAFEKIASGACLIELYSAILFQGPNVVNRINKELAAILRERGFSSVMDAIGSDFK